MRQVEHPAHGATVITVQNVDDISGRLEAIAKDIELLQAAAVARLGERLHEARELFRYKRNEGGFQGWYEQRLGMSRGTVYRSINVYERLGENLSQIGTLSRSAIYALAAPSTPAELQADVIDRAANGETFTHEQIKAMIDDARAEDHAQHDRLLAEQRKRFDRELAETRAEAERQLAEFNARFAGKLVLSPEQVADEANKIVGKLNDKITRLEQKIAELNERERIRKERAGKPKPDKPPIDNAMLGASTSIKVALTGLSDRLAITPLQLVTVETRCLSATGERLHHRIGESLRAARQVSTWLNEFIERGEAACKKE